MTTFKALIKPDDVHALVSQLMADFSEVIPSVNGILLLALDTGNRPVEVMCTDTIDDLPNAIALAAKAEAASFIIARHTPAAGYLPTREEEAMVSGLRRLCLRKKIELLDYLITGNSRVSFRQLGKF